MFVASVCWRLLINGYHPFENCETQANCRGVNWLQRLTCFLKFCMNCCIFICLLFNNHLFKTQHHNIDIGTRFAYFLSKTHFFWILLVAQKISIYYRKYSYSTWNSSPISIGQRADCQSHHYPLWTCCFINSTCFVHSLCLYLSLLVLKFDAIFCPPSNLFSFLITRFDTHLLYVVYSTTWAIQIFPLTFYSTDHLWYSFNLLII